MCGVDISASCVSPGRGVLHLQNPRSEDRSARAVFRGRLDEAAPSWPDDDQSLITQDRERMARGVPRDAVALHERDYRRDFLARAQVTGLDTFTNQSRYLEVWRDMRFVINAHAAKVTDPARPQSPWSSPDLS